MTAAAVSKHLAVLKDAGLVRVRQDGKYLYYELNASVLEEVLLWLRDLGGKDETAR
jgi:DNA-binding transcriptional ArsR family regulator